MTRRLPNAKALPVLASAVVVIVAAVAWHGAPALLGGGLLYLLPVVLLFVALAVARRYPGERALLALMRRKPRRFRVDRVADAAGESRHYTVLPRGGRLIAFSLAVRPPPARVVVLLD
jgi:hypothetical protein